jgi:F-type H+-transporting ATPase subunit epsilon
MKTLRVTVAKIDGPVFNGEAISVTVPGVEGEMTILPHHEAIISPLKKGVITVRSAGGKEEFFDIEKGILEVSGNQATVLM